MIKPLVTEKSYRLSAGDKSICRQFTFLIDKSLNKFQAKKLIEETFSVNVLNCQTLNQKGILTYFRRQKGYSKDHKKVIVKLKAGQIIKSFEIEEKTNDEKK